MNQGDGLSHYFTIYNTDLLPTLTFWIFGSLVCLQLHNVVVSRSLVLPPSALWWRYDICSNVFNIHNLWRDNTSLFLQRKRQALAPQLVGSICSIGVIKAWVSVCLLSSLLRGHHEEGQSEESEPLWGEHRHLHRVLQTVRAYLLRRHLLHRHDQLCQVNTPKRTQSI